MLFKMLFNGIQSSRLDSIASDKKGKRGCFKIIRNPLKGSITASVRFTTAL